MSDTKLFSGDEIFYNKHKPEVVVVQINFDKNPISNIELRGDFKAKIVGSLPDYQEHIVNNNQVTINGNEILQDTQINKVHVFKDKKNGLVLSLASSYISIELSNYSGFNQVKENIVKIVEYFGNIYSEVKNYNRIGLRYVNVFQKSKLDIAKDEEWFNLIDKKYLGFYSELGNDKLVAMKNEFVIKIDSISSVRILMGFVTEGGGKPDNKEICFMLDSDFYSEGSFKKEDIINKISFLHNNYEGLVSEVITKELKNKMEPK